MISTLPSPPDDRPNAIQPMQQDKLEQETKETPLQEKLDDMANLIG